MLVIAGYEQIMKAWNISLKREMKAFVNAFLSKNPKLHYNHMVVCIRGIPEDRRLNNGSGSISANLLRSRSLPDTTDGELPRCGPQLRIHVSGSHSPSALAGHKKHIHNLCKAKLQGPINIGSIQSSLSQIQIQPYFYVHCRHHLFHCWEYFIREVPNNISDNSELHNYEKYKRLILLA